MSGKKNDISRALSDFVGYFNLCLYMALRVTTVLVHHCSAQSFTGDEKVEEQTSACIDNGSQNCGSVQQNQDHGQ